MSSRLVFADSGGLIAMGDPDDEWHEAAMGLNRELLEGGWTFLTTNLVFAETITFLRYHAGHRLAVQLGEALLGSRVYRIDTVETSVDRDAWAIFKRYNDKDFSFVDCASFVVMKRHQLTRAFTNDRHFEQMGFQRLLV